jgi:hypothetical protein
LRAEKRFFNNGIGTVNRFNGWFPSFWLGCSDLSGPKIRAIFTKKKSPVLFAKKNSAKELANFFLAKMRSVCLLARRSTTDSLAKSLGFLLSNKQLQSLIAALSPMSKRSISRLAATDRPHRTMWPGEVRNPKPKNKTKENDHA